MIVDDPMRDEDVPAFMKSFDAVVSTHRSEGFGLTPFYAMALGVPVVATDYGGVTDFCCDDTAWLVDVDRMTEPSGEEKKIFGHLRGIQWAEPSLESAKAMLRECFSNEAERDKRVQKGRSLVADHFSYARCASALTDAFNAAMPNCLSKTVPAQSFVNEKFEGDPFKMLEL